jgi:hypothetical protein
MVALFGSTNPVQHLCRARQGVEQAWHGNLGMRNALGGTIRSEPACACNHMQALPQPFEGEQRWLRLITAYSKSKSAQAWAQRSLIAALWIAHGRLGGHDPKGGRPRRIQILP